MRVFLSTIGIWIANFAFIFNPFYAQAQGLDSLQIQAATAAADLLFYNYQYEQAAKAYENIALNARPELTAEIAKSHLQAALSLQNMQELGQAADKFNFIYDKTVQNKTTDAYTLALAWLAKANYFYYYKQKDSLATALEKADAYITKVPEQENFWEAKAYYYYQKQNILTDPTQALSRKSVMLSGLIYVDKIKNENCLLRLIMYERWYAVAINIEELIELEKIKSKLEKLFKNPYFLPYKRVKANYLLKNMMVVGFTQDSVHFAAAAKNCEIYLTDNNLLNTTAQIEYLKTLAAVTKDKRVNYPLARQIYAELLATAEKNGFSDEKNLLFDPILNYAYTLIDNRQTDTTIVLGLALLEKMWQWCLTEPYKGAKWGEYPDMSQTAVRAFSVRASAAVLQALIYGYHLHYLKFKKEPYKVALLNTLKAAETLQYGAYKNSVNDVERESFAYAISELLSRKVGIYRNWYQQNPNVEDLNLLWEIAQQSNARASRYSQSEEKALNTAGVEPKLIIEFTELKKQLSAAYLRLSVAQKDNNIVEMDIWSKQSELINKKLADSKTAIGKKYPLFKQLVGELDWLKIEEVRPWLNNSALLLHYCSRLENYQILVTSDTVLFYSCFLKKEDVGRKIIDSLNLFISNPPSSANPNAVYKEELEKILLRTRDTFFRQWAYLEKQNIKNIIIVPDELTAAIPFEILLTTSNNKDKSYNEWAWAANKYTFQYLPSLSFWKQSRQQSQANTHNGKVLAFAPTYQNGVKNKQRSQSQNLLRANLSELAGAKSELANLEKYYYGDFYSGSEATEAVLKAQAKEAYSIIHFAMHGLLDENLPEMSSLAFSETVDTMEDNFLSAYEIAKLPQRCQLVVLSACETAKGKQRIGEGVMSLAQYFMYGGAPAVVATRWQVNDQATAFIMQNFYKYLYEGQTIKAALKAAQLDYLKQARGDGAHPFYWAAFTNIGNTDAAVYVAPRNWAMRYWIIGGASLLLLSLWGWWKFRKRE